MHTSTAHTLLCHNQQQQKKSSFVSKGNGPSTGKSVSESLILESVNPQYDEKLFIELPKKYKFRTCCVQILF